MIDKAELDGMRQRSDAARPAVEAVAIRDGGLYADQPIDDPVGLLRLAAGSAADVPALADECERLTPASYLSGPEACVEGDCDCPGKPDGRWCSNVVEKVATFDDVKRAEHLAALAQALKRAAEAAQRGGRIDDRDLARIVIETVDDALAAMEAAESAGWAH